MAIIAAGNRFYENFTEAEISVLVRALNRVLIDIKAIPMPVKELHALGELRSECYEANRHYAKCRESLLKEIERNNRKNRA